MLLYPLKECIQIVIYEISIADNVSPFLIEIVCTTFVKFPSFSKFDKALRRKLFLESPTNQDFIAYRSSLPGRYFVKL